MVKAHYVQPGSPLIRILCNPLLKRGHQKIGLTMAHIVFLGPGTIVGAGLSHASRWLRDPEGYVPHCMISGVSTSSRKHPSDSHELCSVHGTEE